MADRRYKKASTRIAKRRKARKYLSIFLKTALLASLLALVVVLIRADFMQVKNFEIAGTESMPKDKIISIAAGLATGTKLFVVPKSNILFLNKKNMASALLSDFTEIEKIEIKRNFFNQTVKININERKGEFLWCSDADECFLMTGDGLIFEKADNRDGKVIFRGIVNGNPILKNYAVAEKMKNYSEFAKNLMASGFEINWIKIESEDKGIVSTGRGDIIFNPQETDLITVAQNVVLLINEIKAKNPAARFEYIDARFGNKLFYKLI